MHVPAHFPIKQHVSCILQTAFIACVYVHIYNCVSAARHLHVGMTSIQNGGYFWLKFYIM